MGKKFIIINIKENLKIIKQMQEKLILQFYL